MGYGIRDTGYFSRYPPAPAPMLRSGLRPRKTSVGAFATGGPGNPVTRDDGAILLAVLIVILTIALMGATLMALFFDVLSVGQVELDRARALYLAEAGVAKAISMLKSQAGVGTPVESEQIIPPTALGEGFFEVYNDFPQSTIVSMGVSHGVKRTIQVKYNAF